MAANQKLPPEVGWELFRRLMKKHQVRANFWCSEAYSIHAGFHWFTNSGWAWPGGEDPTFSFFPPLPLYEWDLDTFPPIKEIWADFGPHPVLDPVFAKLGFSPVFLDWEYRFFSALFLEQSGGKWAVYRKNVRKWAKRHETHNLVYRPISPSDDVSDVLIEWLSGKTEEPIEDSEVLLSYVPEIENLWGLFRDKELVGINGWEVNWDQIIYRYCFCLPEPYLAHYMRHLFYEGHAHPLPINDGGTLGKSSLKFFKDKMNPAEVRRISTWIRGEHP